MSDMNIEIETRSVNLDGKALAFGPVHFVRAEWRGHYPAPHLVVLRYTIDGKGEAPLGIRLDLDKQAILDEIDDIDGVGPDINRAIRDQAADISDAVVNEYRTALRTGLIKLPPPF